MILPGIFPYLITGLVTASGGAWNASIIAEYFRLKNQTLQTVGPGRGDQRGDRQRAVSDSAAGDHRDGD